MKASTIEKYRLMIDLGPFSTPPGRAVCALRNAKTMETWDELESCGLVRLVLTPEEERYFDVFGVPDTQKEREDICLELDRLGCYCVSSEYFDGEEWQFADGVGMCVYEDPASPLCNPYVIDLMRSAIDMVETNKGQRP